MRCKENIKQPINTSKINYHPLGKKDNIKNNFHLLKLNKLPFK